MVLLCCSQQLKPLCQHEQPHCRQHSCQQQKTWESNPSGAYSERISWSHTKENCKVLLSNPRAGLLCGVSPPSPVCFHTLPRVQRTCWRETSPVALPLLGETLTPCFGKPVPASSTHHAWHLLQLQPDSGCACTCTALNPSSRQCHRLQPNYTGHELDPVHTETATACS